jgi:zinc protease
MSFWRASKFPNMAVLGLFGVLLVVSAVNAAPPALPDEDLAHPNPAAVSGRLPNGVRYTILQRPSHNKESLRLLVYAGSRDETDAERGVAHFVEHMAFVGPRHFPTDQVQQTFGQAGIAWGRDQNAYTRYLDTLYYLDIPEVSEAKLDLGFRWLGDVANGLTFDPAAVARERKVVLQEYVLGLGPAKDAARQRETFATPDLRGVTRPPIGDEQVIRAVDAATLSRFHAKWYRPDRTLVVAVGDEPVEAVRRRIAAAFGSWRATGPAPPHPGEGAIDLKRPSDALAITEPKLPGVVYVCRLGDADPESPEGVATHRLTLADEIWVSAMGRRFADLIQSRSPPVSQAYGSQADVYKAGASTCVTAAPINNDWKGALKLLSDEARRMSVHGITGAEFDFAKSQIITGLDQAVANDSTADASGIANNILWNDEEGQTFDTAAEDRRVQLRALAQLDPGSVSDAFRRRWDQRSAPLVVVVSPSPVARSEVLSAWAADLAAPTPGAEAEKALSVWRYDNFGQPGKVKLRESLHDPDFVRLTFENGVVVNFKQTGFAKNAVETLVRFGAGQQEIEPGHVFEAQFGAGNLFTGGLGKDSAENIADVCKGHACAAELAMGRTSFALSGATRTDDLRLELQLLAAFLTDPGFDNRMDQQLPSVVHAMYRQLDSNPAAMAALAYAKALPTPHVADLPSEAAMAAITSADFRRYLAGPLQTDAIEITMVGDVPEDQATHLIAETFGALKPRPRANHTRPDAVRARLPAKAPPRILATHKGPGEQAVVIMTWPLYVWDKTRVHEGRVMTLLGDAFQNEITDRVRRDLGKAYAPGVGLSVDDSGDQGTLSVVVQTTPADLEAVIAAVTRIAREFTAGAITSEELERAREPILASVAQERTYNGWWVEKLNGSFEHPEQLEWTRTRDHDMATISLDEVKAEARLWLSRNPMIVVSLPETPALATPDGPKAGGR